MFSLLQAVTSAGKLPAEVPGKCECKCDHMKPWLKQLKIRPADVEKSDSGDSE